VHPLGGLGGDLATGVRSRRGTWIARQDPERHYNSDMGHQPSLDMSGDPRERETWPALRDFFPAYQKFWRLHIVPLRSRGGIHLRSGLPQPLERMAMNHYTCYVALAEAFRVGSSDPEEAEPTYVQLQRAAENGIAVIQSFRAISRECTGREVSIQADVLQGIMKRLKSYRNFVHESVIGTKRHSESGKILVPKPDMMTCHATWSSMRVVKEADLVPLQQQFWNDFMALCTALQSCWTQMIALSNGLAKSRRYRQMQEVGTDYAPTPYPTSFPGARSSVQ